MKYESRLKQFHRTLQELEYKNRKSKGSKWCRVRENARAVADRCGFLNMPCYQCGYDKHVEICHIKDIHTFSENEKIGIVNNPNNLIQLCRNCHWEFDNNLLFLKDNRERIIDPYYSYDYKPTLSSKSKKKCLDCDNNIRTTSKRCKRCSQRKAQKTKIDWPHMDELQFMVNISSYSSVARQLGVSDNAVRKRLMRR